MIDQSQISSRVVRMDAGDQRTGRRSAETYARVMSRMAYLASRVTASLSVMLLLPLAVAEPSLSEERLPKLEILSSAEIPKEASGQKIGELSGLAWDGDENLLYAVSDDGLIHHFVLRLDGARIAELKPVFSGRLSPVTGEGSNRALRNAEGLAALNAGNGKRSDTELLVALEDGPAIARFTPKGQYIASAKLPGPLADKNSYNDDKERLESVAVHPLHGLLTAPERPLLGPSRDHHTVFAADGRTWSFKTFQPKRSSLKAVETMPDGGLLILERTRDEQGGAAIARLRHVDLPKCAADGSCVVVDPPTSSGEIPPGNYEGLTRISDDLYLMVSDHKKRDATSAKLVLFRFKVSR
jgi:hypothetical protein